MRSRRTNNLIKANRENAFLLGMYSNSGHFPNKRILARDTKNITVSISEPVYHNKREFLAEPNESVFMEVLPYDIDWLFQLGVEVCTLKSKSEKKSVFTDSKLDIINPGLSAFRIYNFDKNNKTDFEDFFQVQVHPIKEVKGLFQLDVFENKSYGMVNTMILACDVTQTKQIQVDIMGLRGYEFEDAKDYAGKIGTLFCDLLIYLRVWDYNVKCKSCIFQPLFDFNSTTFPYLLKNYDYSLPKMPEF